MRGSLLGIATLLVALSAAAAPEPLLHFDGARVLRLEERQDPFQLRKKLYPALKAAGVWRIEVVAGGESMLQERSPSGMMYLDGLPLEALHGVLLVLPDECEGAEIDLLVKGTGAATDPDRIWTVRRDLRGRIFVERGGPPLALEGPDPTAEELWERFGVRAVALPGAAWSPDERRALAKALELLSPEELALVAGTTFERASRVRQGHPGLHTPSRLGEPSNIRLFDAAFARDAGRVDYVGAPERAVPLPVFVILHQIGHALASAERRRLLVERQDEVESYESERAPLEQQRRFASIQRLDTELEELRTGLGSVERRYAELPGALEGPTEQGRRDAKESFAEAFALYHVDPESLRWIAPQAHAWFAAAAHLRSQTAVDVATPGD